MSKPFEDPKRVDDSYELESLARSKVLARKISLAEYLGVWEKIVTIGQDREGQPKSEASIENAFTYYRDAYERLLDVSRTITDEVVDRKLIELNQKLETLIAEARQIVDAQLADKLQRRLDRIK